MNDNTPYELMAKLFAGNISDKEKTTLEVWRDESEENKVIFNHIKASWDISTPPDHAIDLEAALKKVSGRLDAQNKPRKLAPWLSLAAAVLLVFGLFAIIRNVVLAPGMVELSTIENEVKETHTLPDGSIVTLNAGSMLSYTKEFNKNERRLRFSGEAYFDIKTDSLIPFVIETGKTETRVLGTAFNLIARADSSVQVIVTKGLVSLKLTENHSETILLEAGQVGEYEPRLRQINKHENTNQNFLSWKDGRLTFTNQALKSALDQLSKHYKVQFISTNASLDSALFTASFDNLSLEETIENLELIMDVEVFKEEGVYVIVD
jgi:transmembrane sensor